jgi:hypothetical protein
LVEILVSGGTVINMDPKRRFIKEGVVAIEGGHIVDVDVDTVIFDGEVLMENRVVKTVDEAEVLETVQEEAEAAISCSGFGGLLEYADRYWGHSRY